MEPVGGPIEVAGAAEVSTMSPGELAFDIRQRFGLGGENSAVSAYVAVEEVVINRRLDSKLRNALKKNLSIIVGGDGKPPSTDRVEPFSFRLVPKDPDPLHTAMRKFRRSQPNIVAACNLSKGNRPLEEYLTEINARISKGLEEYFKDRSEQQPDCILRIVVWVGETDRQDNELRDNKDGIWRIIKLRCEQDDYVAYENDIQTAKAWVDAELSQPFGSA